MGKVVYLSDVRAVRTQASQGGNGVRYQSVRILENRQQRAGVERGGSR